MIMQSVRIRLAQPRNRGSIRSRGKRFFLFSKTSGPALGPTRPSVQCEEGVSRPEAAVT